MRRAVALTAWATLACGALAAPAAAQPAFENDEACWDSGEEYSPEQQIAACDALLESEGLPEEERAYIIAMRGWSYEELGDYDRAVAEYSEKIRLQPDAADGYGWRAGAHLNKGDYASAVADFSQAIRLGPDATDFAGWHNDRGVAKFNLGDSRGAIEDYSAAIELSDGNPLNYLNRGDAYLALEEYGRAIEDYTRAINLAPDAANNWNSRCWVRAVWGRQLVEALDDCNESIGLDPDNFNAYDSRGLIHLRRQDWNEALADYAASLAIEASASAFFGHAIALKRLGSDAEAEADFAEAAAHDPTIAETYADFGIEP